MEFPLLTRQLSLYSASGERGVRTQQNEIGRLQEQLTTGRRVNRPSDDATSFARARELESLTRQYEQHQRSISTARSWLDHTQENLNILTERFAEAYEDGVRAANSTFNTDEYEAMASRLEAVRDEILETMNVKVGDAYLFAGTQTDTEPFQMVGATVNYNGNTGSLTRQIGPAVTVDINIDGDRLHDTGGGFTITEALQGLIDAVRLGDQAQIDTAVGQVQTARNHVVDLGAEAGTVANRLDTADAFLRESILITEGQQSLAEDTDYIETFTELQNVQTSLQAALRATATTLQTSILDYLR